MRRDRGALSRRALDVEAPAQLAQSRAHEAQPVTGGAGVSIRLPRGQIETGAVVDDVEAHDVVGVDETHHDAGGSGVQPHVRQSRLGDAQQRHLDLGGQNRQGVVDVQLGLKTRLVVRAIQHPLQRRGERVVLEFGRGERLDDPADVGEAVAGELLDLPERAHGLRVVGARRAGVREQADR